MLAGDERLRVIPVLAGDCEQRVLEPVVFTGQARHRELMRRSWLRDEAREEGPVEIVLRHNRPGLDRNIAVYENTLPFEPWMGGGRLMLLCEWSKGDGCPVELRPLVVARIAESVAPHIAFVVCGETSPGFGRLSVDSIYADPRRLSLADMCALAASFPLDSPECAYICSLALEHYPDAPCAGNNMAAIALRRGDRAMAVTCLEGFADDPLVQNNLGIACLMGGERDEARRRFERGRRAGSREAAYNLSRFEALWPEWYVFASRSARKYIPETLWHIFCFHPQRRAHPKRDNICLKK